MSPRVSPRALALLLLAACSSPAEPSTEPADGGADVALSDATGDTGAAGDTGSTDGGAGDVPFDTAGYPAGPYGTAVGDTLANLQLEGYVRFGDTTGLAKDVPYGPTSFADLRARSPQKWAILHVSGFT
jgi:hypothetical protein